MSIKDEIQDMRETFAKPKHITDVHLFVFVIQILIMLAFSIGLFNMMAQDKPELITDKGLIKSYFSSFDTGMGDKTLFNPITWEEDMTNVVRTDKFIDLKNEGLWLTQRQETAIVCTWAGIIGASIVYLLLGLGKIYRRLREPYFEKLKATAPLLFFPPVGVAVWGGLSIIYWIVVCTAAGIWGVLSYLVHLILGIIQIPKIIASR